MKLLKNRGILFKCVIIFIFIIMEVFPEQFDQTAGVVSLKNKLPELNLKNEPVKNELIYNYENFYKLDKLNVKHYLGYIETSICITNINIFIHPNSKGTVFIFHGYLSHSGLMSNAISDFLDAGYSVVLPDLPGHGLSNGVPADIEDFSDYGKLVNEVFENIKNHLPGPYYIIGHSTGASGVIEYCYKYKSDEIEKIVLLAPLVHFVFYDLSKASTKVFKKMSADVPRIFRKSSHDKNYLEFIEKKDPLQWKQVPITWTRALYNWNSMLVNRRPLNKKILIIQGKKDNIVDYKYNIEFLMKIFPDLEYRIIKKARHDLLNETDKYRTKVINKCVEYFEN